MPIQDSSDSNNGHAMAAAYRLTAYTMEEIADHFHVSAHTVSRAIRIRKKYQPRDLVGCRD
jgi:hypothetical protein